MSAQEALAEQSECLCVCVCVCVCVSVPGSVSASVRYLWVSCAHIVPMGEHISSSTAVPPILPKGG